MIGAGPVGLFTVFQFGMLGMKCRVIDSLEAIGGQCAALYPEKPIYDIPGYPEVSGGRLINALEQAAVTAPSIGRLSWRASQQKSPWCTVAPPSARCRKVSAS